MRENELRNAPSQFIPKLDEETTMRQVTSGSESPTDVDTANISPEEHSEYDRFFDEATLDDIREIADILGIAYQVRNKFKPEILFEIPYNKIRKLENGQLRHLEPLLKPNRYYCRTIARQPG